MLANLKLTTVAPPGRNFSTHILKHTSRKIALTEAMIERHLFPKYVLENGQPKVVRPPQYDPSAPPAQAVQAASSR
jgi:hypothetical protein